MCVVGLYFVFLLLEDVIVGLYTTAAAPQDQEQNIKTAYDFFQKDRFKSVDSANFFRQNNGRQPFRFVLNISTTSGRPLKKRQVGRVTQKQYEIINMLWRKTKFFVDEKDIYTTKPTQRSNITKVTLKRFKQNNLLKIPTLTTSTQMTTSSKIEFYYLDDIESHVKKDICVELNCKNNTAKHMSSDSAKETSNPPFLVFHLKGPYAKHKSANLQWNSLYSNNSYFINDQVSISGIRLNKLQKATQQVKLDLETLTKETNKKIIEKATHRVATRKKYLGNAYLTHITKPSATVNNSNDGQISNIDHKNPKSTTVYDKIKFFEMYDQNTQPPKNPMKVNKLNKTDVDDEKIILNDRNMLLEDIDQDSQDLKQAKHSKKHITDHSENLNKSWWPKTYTENKKPRNQIIENTRQTNELYISNGNLTKFVPKNNKSVLSYTNKNASWSDYPFAAVYINEQSQVHCDAAGISAHWLVVSGACLSRVSKKLDGEGRSAFVVYCGELWWQPERVAYVKYSILHPSYHPRDQSRRHLYNIGVIQVVNSMLSCSGWAPVSLISHQFAAGPGSWALAVGWGLDRFDTRYGATDLPRNPLTTYKSRLYFDSCPGNTGYSKAKRLDEGGGARNVHCLSLPPYTGEDSDPVHGGLLLVGGKLIALYLQEERRPWGEQSAQYTGVWRLIPWVMNVAREPEDIDTSIFEI